MDLTEQLVGGGTSNRGDYWQASTVFQQARADVALLTATIAQDRNALELLAGGPLDDSLLPDALPPQLDWFADVPAGLSSQILLDAPRRARGRARPRGGEREHRRGARAVLPVADADRERRPREHRARVAVHRPGRDLDARAEPRDAAVPRRREPREPRLHARRRRRA